MPPLVLLRGLLLAPDLRKLLSDAIQALLVPALALLGRRKRAGFGKIPAAHKPAKLPKAAKAAPPAEGEAKPGFMASVKARLMPGRGREAVPELAEPVLTDVISRPE